MLEQNMKLILFIGGISIFIVLMYLSWKRKDNKRILEEYPRKLKLMKVIITFYEEPQMFDYHHPEYNPNLTIAKNSASGADMLQALHDAKTC